MYCGANKGHGGVAYYFGQTLFKTQKKPISIDKE
jgi:hypothetical protein